MAGLYQLPILAGEAKEEVVPPDPVLLVEKPTSGCRKDGGLGHVARLGSELVEAVLKDDEELRVGISVIKIFQEGSKV